MFEAGVCTVRSLPLVVYAALYALYLAKGWLGLVVRFGRFDPKG